MGIIFAIVAATPLLLSERAWSQDANPSGAQTQPQQSAPPAAQPAPPQTQPAASDPAAAPSSAASPPVQLPATPVDVAEQPSAGPSSPGIDRSHLPQDLSPWGMFEAADMVVKSVMIGLAFASLVTWTVWLAKSIELFTASRKLRQGLARIGSTASLAEAWSGLGSTNGVLAAQLNAAAEELQMSMHLQRATGIKERVQSRLQRIEAAAGRSMSFGTGVLATIGATAPFVGLFGTVWGIMNSFIGISKSQTTNLAVVAPGIAEALLATAIGLVAAIPAVIIYNHFARSIAGYKALVADGSALVMRLVSRDLDRGGVMHEAARAAE